jgi:hypothetical protein
VGISFHVEAITGAPAILQISKKEKEEE